MVSGVVRAHEDSSATEKLARPASLALIVLASPVNGNWFRFSHTLTIRLFAYDFPSQGVRCVDTETGAQCGPCPAGFIGDGMRCRPDNACKSSPCFAGLLYYLQIN